MGRLNVLTLLAREPPPLEGFELHIDGVPLPERPGFATVPSVIEGLRGRPRHDPDELAPGRVPLLVCVACEDLGCGALSCAVTVDGDVVTWSDLRWARWDEDGEPVPGGPYRFAREAYVAALARAS